MGRIRIDVTGQRVGKLVALELVDFEYFKLWKCQCDCGNITMLKWFGTTKSCGCLSKHNKARNLPEIYIKNCFTCGSEFKTILKTQKCCNESCGSKLKFLNNPELREICSENGKKAMAYLHANGLANISKPGMHTEEFKEKLSIRASQPKTDITKERIKENHWAYNLQIKEEVVERILKTRSENPDWNTDERRHKLSNYVFENPSCVKTHKFYKIGHYYNKFTNEMEYHHSGYERKFMEFLNVQPDVIFWTKKHKIFIDYIFGDKVKKYWPDFYIEFDNGFKTIVELKGFEEDPTILECKIAAGIEYCNNNNLTYQIIFQKSANDFKNLLRGGHPHSSL